MNWRRIHAGGDETHRKEWIGGHGQYKIIWRNQVQGVDVPSAFHVLVLEIAGGVKFWELLHKTKRLKRTLKAAKRACEVHASPPKKRKKMKNV